MVIFHSYVKLPEGKSPIKLSNIPNDPALCRQAGEGAARRLGRGVRLRRLTRGGRRHGRWHWVGLAAARDGMNLSS